MSTIQKWVDVKAMPHLKNTERLISVLFTLGAATREQLSIITGWSEIKVRDTIHLVRNLEPIPPSIKKQKEMLKGAEYQLQQGKITQIEYDKMEIPLLKQLEKLNARRDSWVTIIKPKPRDPSFYTLGRLGADYAKEIREEYRSNTVDDAKRQLRHFHGITEILCRIRQKGVSETEWLSAREVGQSINYYWQRYLYREAKRKKGNIEKPHIPYKPDAFLRLDEDKYYIEFDTNSESPERLRTRFFNCLRLYSKIHDPHKKRLPNEIIWVTTSAYRKRQIEEIAIEVLEDFREDQNNQEIRVPTSYCFVEGEEIPFLLEAAEYIPFWVDIKEDETPKTPV